MSLLRNLFPGRTEEVGPGGRWLDGLALYTTEGCWFCTRVRNAMARDGIDFELRDVRRDPAHRQELLREGGKSQVPCLRIETLQGVEWLYESGDIVRYLERYRQRLAQE
ncbi:MAG TPA: glutaredoxin [Thermoanaerobaculia bacterium]|nr:glutaredoxin [Thermoanaerobaculia bacterium]